MSNYKMSEYCEELTRAALGIEIEDPIPADVFSAVSDAQHDNDVIDGPKLTIEDVSAIIADMPKSKPETTDVTTSATQAPTNPIPAKKAAAAKKKATK
mgnify:CR=1 FL=1